MQRRFLPLALLTALVACATPASTGSLPAFPAYLPERAGEERIYLLAKGYGRLTQRGRCLGIVGRSGEFATVIWPYTARLGRDRRGLFVTDSESGARIRLGQRFEFGGGRSPNEALPQMELTEPVPPECVGTGVATLNPGFRERY